MADYKLKIYTQEKKVFEGEVTSLVAPGEKGYLGVLAHHAPLLTTLGEGKLTIRQGGREEVFQISGGFLEVHNNEATVLADRLIQ
jgi:F-type H+-transporting ATPase subunit epsilon